MGACLSLFKRNNSRVIPEERDAFYGLVGSSLSVRESSEREARLARKKDDLADSALLCSSSRWLPTSSSQEVVACCTDILAESPTIFPRISYEDVGVVSTAVSRKAPLPPLRINVLPFVDSLPAAHKDAEKYKRADPKRKENSTLLSMAAKDYFSDAIRPEEKAEKCEDLEDVAAEEDKHKDAEKHQTADPKRKENSTLLSMAAKDYFSDAIHPEEKAEKCEDLENVAPEEDKHKDAEKLSGIFSDEDTEGQRLSRSKTRNHPRREADAVSNTTASAVHRAEKSSSIPITSDEKTGEQRSSREMARNPARRPRTGAIPKRSAGIVHGAEKSSSIPITSDDKTGEQRSSREMARNPARRPRTGATPVHAIPVNASDEKNTLAEQTSVPSISLNITGDKRCGDKIPPLITGIVNNGVQILKVQLGKHGYILEEVNVRVTVKSRAVFQPSEGEPCQLPVTKNPHCQRFQPAGSPSGVSRAEYTFPDDESKEESSGRPHEVAKNSTDDGRVVMYDEEERRMMGEILRGSGL